jgi:hypothetical protein
VKPKEFRALLESEPPFVEAADIEMLDAGGQRGVSELFEPRPSIRFSWRHSDGRTLHYYRVKDADGDRFYPPDEALRRLTPGAA